MKFLHFDKAKLACMSRNELFYMFPMVYKYTVLNSITLVI